MPIWKVPHLLVAANTNSDLCHIICITQSIGRTIELNKQTSLRVLAAAILVLFVCHQAKVVEKMMYVIVCLVALGASFLTLFSGFGQSTLLMPAFALFFPLETAIAMTAVVHLANNVFKLVLVGRKVDKEVLLKFALPGIAAAFVGAWLLNYFSGLQPIASYDIGQRGFQISVFKVIIGLLMIGFALIELHPRFEKMAFAKKWLPLGGAVSGFFGGLSGHQGALRSAFLSKAGLEKEAFIATGVAAAFLIDLTRLSVYANHLGTIGTDADWSLVSAAIVAAFAGAFVGSRLLQKVTLRVVQIIVGVMLALVGVLLAVGLM